MATGKGSQFQLLLGEEGTFGTPATNFTKVPVSSVGGNWFRQNLIDNPEIRANRNPAPPVLGNKIVNGSFTAPLHYDAVGWILKNAIGWGSEAGTDPWTHIGKVGFIQSGAPAVLEEGLLPTGMTFEHGFTDLDLYHVYTGCKVSSFGVSASSEGVAQFDVGIVGADVDDIESSTLDAAPVEYTTVAQSHFTGTIEEGGGSIAYVQSIDFTLDNGLDDSQYVVGGAGALSELPENMASLTGNVTALFQSNALLLKAINNTETSLQLAWTDSTNSLTFDIPEIYLEAAAPTVDATRGVLITLPFRAFYQNHADATLLKYTLVNAGTSGLASYSAIGA